MRLSLAVLGKLCRFLLPLLKGLLQALTLGSGLDLVLAPAWELWAGLLGADGSPEAEVPSGKFPYNRSIEAAMMGAALSMVTTFRRSGATKSLLVPLAILIALAVLRALLYARGLG
jgi:hypothetical protein